MFARRTGLSRFVRVSESKIRIQANHTFFLVCFCLLRSTYFRSSRMAEEIHRSEATLT